MTVYEGLSLMIAFATLVVLILSFRKKRHEKNRITRLHGFFIKLKICRENRCRQTSMLCVYYSVLGLCLQAQNAFCLLLLKYVDINNSKKSCFSDVFIKTGHFL